MKKLILIKIISFFIIIYILFSTAEWAVHKYFMHTKRTFLGKFIESIGEYHIIHHIATRPDMSIDISTDDYEKLGREENMCLYWSDIIPMTIPVMIITMYIAYVMKINIWIPIVITVIIVVYSVSMWNTLHPAIHNRSGYNIGAPFAIKEGTFAYNTLINSYLGQFLWENHVLHHNIKKPHKTNFNITLPFADYAYGTHSSYIM